MLGGALLLVVADTLARTIAAPAEIPVGLLTSLLGGPYFLYLLMRRNRAC
jgi:iron complex transport system permease protein